MGFWANAKQSLIENGLTPDYKDRVRQAMHHMDSAGFDRWGVDPESIQASLSLGLWLYRNYFRVETIGIENIPSGRVLLVGNHGGQVPIDGMLIATAVLAEANPPRLARGMVERWAPTVPFISTFFSRTGQITGDVKNCQDLLERDECVMVFPEGTNGSGKTVFNRYELQKFGSGFLRLALETNAPIVPVATIGLEEALPSISRLGPIAKLFNIPYLPVIPTGFIPLPTKVTIRFGQPLYFKGNPNQTEEEIKPLVARVRTAIAEQLEIGLGVRGEHIFTRSAIRDEER